MANNKNVTQPKFIPSQELEATASRVLSEHGMDTTIPVDIELLCDRMGIKLLIVPNLHNDFSVDAYITDDCQTIVVDEYSFFNFENRARFSIAHELGHHILHKDFLSQFDIKNIEDYLNFQDSISAEMRKTIEIQAYMIAGYLLIPTDILRAEVTSIIGPVDAASININQVAQVLEILQARFNVSTLALAKQLNRVFPEFAEIIQPILSTQE